jgi:pimeloyl-ACP methyl ester carboxylesterase
MREFALKDGAKLAYADQGKGAPILLVHGWAGNGAFFQNLATRLAASRRVIVPTLRGHPGSDAGKAPLTIETLADDLVQLVEALELDEVVALGWSMGAMALWAAAPRLGERLSGLIVEDMAPRLTNDHDWRHGLSDNYAAEDISDTLAEIKADWPAYVSRLAPRLFAPSVQEQRPELVQWASAQMSMASPAAMAAFWASMAAQDFRGAIAAIAQPMLAIHGRESQVHCEAATAFVANSAPNGDFAVIPGAGHAPHLEAPDAFFHHVEAFVRKTRRPELRSGGVKS